MSIFSDLKKLWDVLHPSISTKRALTAGLIVTGVLLSWVIVPAVLISCTVYGVSSLKEFFWPSEKKFANNLAPLSQSNINLPRISVTPAQEQTLKSTEVAMKRKNDLHRLFSSSQSPTSSATQLTEPKVPRRRSFVL